MSHLVGYCEIIIVCGGSMIMFVNLVGHSYPQTYNKLMNRLTLLHNTVFHKIILFIQFHDDKPHG